MPVTKKPKRTKKSRSVTSIPTPSRPLPEGFYSERQAAVFLGLSRSALAMYRSRWNNNLPGEHGPLFFEGPFRRVAYRKEDLVEWRDRRRDASLWVPKGDMPTTR
jgi:hypothetical protein